ncbi:MAG: diguanylate cyclase [Deltaproteobacteria bacterium]|nr:diguanylate cyclase [Deltaproteobacteria bacterium]
MLPDPAPSPVRFLIVDDDPGTVRLLARILHDMGEIFFATSGGEALRMMKENQPDLILLDAEMPGMSGFDVCKTIKDDADFSDLPILFVTAHTDIDSETRALEVGAVDFITKPPSPPIVRARVKTHLALKHRTDQLRRLATIDGLTGIANRRSFDNTLEQEWRRACRSGSDLSLLMIDVDFFKLFNDHYGHQAGDDCLRSVASALASLARRPGELAARFGGEEFAVILPACDETNAMRLAELMRVKVAELAIPHAWSNVAPEVTVSIGVASIRSESDLIDRETQAWYKTTSTPHVCQESALELVRVADAALYQAKHDGRNRIANMTISPPQNE